MNQFEQKARHVGFIQVSESLLLELLQYKGGRIITIIGPEQLGVFRFLIEHKDMPEVRHGEHILNVVPQYESTYDECGRLLLAKRV